MTDYLPCSSVEFTANEVLFLAGPTIKPRPWKILKVEPVQTNPVLYRAET
jgi:hypothetical protein